jgi:hypothetical protein
MPDALDTSLRPRCDTVLAAQRTFSLRSPAFDP